MRLISQVLGPCCELLYAKRKIYVFVLVFTIISYYTTPTTFLIPLRLHAMPSRACYYSESQNGIIYDAAHQQHGFKNHSQYVLDRIMINVKKISKKNLYLRLIILYVNSGRMLFLNNTTNTFTTWDCTHPFSETHPYKIFTLG